MSLLGLVGLAALATAAGCYDPEIVDCSVACQAADECADGQVCGADGYCAAPEVAGRCQGQEPARVALEVTIDGDGRVAIDGLGTCDSSHSRLCMFTVLQNQRYRLKAIAGDDRSFESWSSACAGDAETCDVTPVSARTRVGAEFE